jgi:cyclopropane fatty-acyl-phospholipid synthase-like methyltransferase
MHYMQDFWDKHSQGEEFSYELEPNLFFKDELIKLPPGKLLLPFEGEGRNAVFAAAQGWEVRAFDFSEKAKQQALELSRSRKVNIHYETVGWEGAELTANYYDAAGLIYAHLPKESRTRFHHKIVTALRPGGTLILEAFSPEQLGNASGGPKDPAMLYGLQILKDDFEGLEMVRIQKASLVLEEGPGHSQPAEVVRMVACKK